jgi:uncharacterized protein
MASNIEATKKAYETFKRGDIPSLLKDFIDDNCNWISPGPEDKLPWAGTFKGKQEIANFFAQVGQNLDFSEFTPREMIEHGDTVVVLGTSVGRAKKTGKPVKDGYWWTKSITRCANPLFLPRKEAVGAEGQSSHPWDKRLLIFTTQSKHKLDMLRATNSRLFGN